MDQCRASSVTADRTPSALDLVVRQIALAPGRGCHVHVRELPPGAPIDRRLLALRGARRSVGRWRRAERYCVAPTCADGGDPAVARAVAARRSRAAAAARLASGRGASRGGVRDAGEVRRSDHRLSVRVSRRLPRRRCGTLGRGVAITRPLPPHPPATRLYRRPARTSTVRPGPRRHAEPVIEENAPRSNPATPAFEEKPAPAIRGRPAEDARARSAPETAAPAADERRRHRPPRQGLNRLARATGTLLPDRRSRHGRAVVEGRRVRHPWLAVVALTFGVSGRSSSGRRAVVDRRQRDGIRSSHPAVSAFATTAALAWR